MIAAAGAGAAVVRAAAAAAARVAVAVAGAVVGGVVALAAAVQVVAVQVAAAAARVAVVVRAAATGKAGAAVQARVATASVEVDHKVATLPGEVATLLRPLPPTLVPRTAVIVEIAVTTGIVTGIATGIETGIATEIETGIVLVDTIGIVTGIEIAGARRKQPGMTATVTATVIAIAIDTFRVRTSRRTMAATNMARTLMIVATRTVYSPERAMLAGDKVTIPAAPISSGTEITASRHRMAVATPTRRPIAMGLSVDMKKASTTTKIISVADNFIVNQIN
jgi:hypothetical protein